MQRVLSAETRAKLSESGKGIVKSPDWRAALSASLLARRAATFWTKVDKSGDCWIWQGRTLRGYGMARYGPDQLAHRVAYRLVVGPIPDGLTIDHLCHNRDASCPGGYVCLHRRCVNPDHLEAVTALENARRADARRVA